MCYAATNGEDAVEYAPVPHAEHLCHHKHHDNMLNRIATETHHRTVQVAAGCRATVVDAVRDPHELCAERRVRRRGTGDISRRRIRVLDDLPYLENTTRH